MNYANNLAFSYISTNPSYFALGNGYEVLSYFSSERSNPSVDEAARRIVALFSDGKLDEALDLETLL